MKSSPTGPDSHLCAQRTIPCPGEGPGRNDLHCGPLASPLSKDDSTVLYLRLKIDRAVRWHVVPDSGHGNQGSHKCKHCDEPRDQPGERRHNVTILTGSRERGTGSMWD